MGIFYTHSKGVDFLVYIFSVFIITLLTASFCAWRYHAQTEKIVLKILMFYNIFVIIAVFILSARVYMSYAAPYLFIALDSFVFFIHRYTKLNWIIKQTELLNGKGAEKP